MQNVYPLIAGLIVTWMDTLLEQLIPENAFRILPHQKAVIITREKMIVMTHLQAYIRRQLRYAI